MRHLGEELATFLIANGCGTALGEDVFVDFLPNDPDTAIAITEYGSRVATLGVEAAERRFQVRVRSNDYDNARALALKAHQVLCDPIEPIKQIADREVIIQSLANPTKLSLDETSRTTFVFNIYVVALHDY